MTAPSSAPQTIVAASDCDDRPAQHVERVERAEVGQREHRSDREIDAADDHDQRLAERDEADLAGLPRGVGEARRREEVVDHAAQREADDQEDDDRDRGLGPTLGQDLAEQMIRPIAVTPAGEGFAHRWPSDMGGSEASETPGAIRASVRAARTLFLQVAQIPARRLAIGVLLGDRDQGRVGRALDRAGLHARGEQILDQRAPSARPASARRS